MYKPLILTLLLLFSCQESSTPTQSSENKHNWQDMLTPAYYSNDDTKQEVDSFLEVLTQSTLHHPLQDSLGNVASFWVPTHGEFGAGKGPNNTSQHHAAVDIHLNNNQTKTALYAAHDGQIKTVKNADKYRHYLSITKEIFNSQNKMVGKLVTLYGHIDLDLDISDGLLMNGKQIKKGALVSKNLYAQTVGGPHLHFEVRLYRINENGVEEFYGQKSATRTIKGTDGFPYGYWQPDVGYGFVDPKTCGLIFY